MHFSLSSLLCRSSYNPSQKQPPASNQKLSPESQPFKVLLSSFEPALQAWKALLREKCLVWTLRGSWDLVPRAIIKVTIPIATCNPN